MANLYVDLAMGYSDIQLNIISELSVEVFPKEISI